jgi:hypothetical protein
MHVGPKKKKKKKKKQDQLGSRPVCSLAERREVK